MTIIIIMVFTGDITHTMGYQNQSQGNDKVSIMVTVGGGVNTLC